ncbi:MAG: hypothetical protein WAL29_00700, partial [Bacteroidales bacterium]
SFDNVVSIPTECVQAGSDSIPFVCGKNRTKQIVVLGEVNEKNVIVEQGLKPGTVIYSIPPEDYESFRVAGQDLIPVIKDREKAKRSENNKFLKEG